jgi:hypothetical protein
MLIIRQSQMESLAQAMREQFVTRGVEHIERLMPNRFHELGAERVRESVVLTLEKADRYGLTLEYDVLRLLNFLYVFGFDADADPRYPWAAQILEDMRLQPTRKMDRLMRRAEHAAEEEKHG